MSSSDAIVLYDADCGVCVWLMGKVLAWDRRMRIRPVALDAPEAEPLLRDLGQEERLASWHLVTAGGRRESGGRALGPLLRRLPGGRPFAAIVERFPGAADVLYYGVAGRRSALGRLVTSGAKRRARRRIARRGSVASSAS